MSIDQSQLTKLSTAFDAYKFTYDGVEAWSARDLQSLLGYGRWENFRHAIQRAIESCLIASRAPDRHFVPVVGKLDISPQRILRGIRKYSRGQPREDMILSRFAAYLVAMNGDPSKEEIAFAQAYFVIQTRKTEVLEDRLAEMERLRARQQLTKAEYALSDVLLFHGVPRAGFAVVRSIGDKALFGGFTTKDMKKRLGCPSQTPLANYLQTVLIKAKELAASITQHNTQVKNMYGVERIASEHQHNNLKVRDALLECDITPENILPAEDTKKIEQRHNKAVRVMFATAEELPSVKEKSRDG